MIRRLREYRHRWAHRLHLEKGLIRETIAQEAKGRLAGEILRVALQRGLNVRSAILLVADDLEAGEAAWEEMHPVAHMWAAKAEFSDWPSAEDLLRGRPSRIDSVKPLLRRSEELLDEMQSRPDLAHPDPWRCSAEIRRLLGLKG